MNKARLLELVKDPGKIHQKDLSQLKELTSQHPYSQIIHILNAKGHVVLDLPGAPNMVHKAATYCSNRIILKHSIEDIEQVADSPPWEEEVDNEPVVNFDWIEEGSGDQVVETETSHQDHHSPAEEGIDHEVADLDNLNDAIAEEPIQSTSEVPGEAELEKEPPEISAQPQDLSPPAASEPSAEDTEEDSPPEEESSVVISSDTDTGQKEQVKETPAENIEDPLDLQIAAEIHQGSIHEELMNNLNKLQQTREQYQESPELDDIPQESEGLQEQIEIIDTFIKNSPVLSKPNLSADSEATSQKDLSKSSATFNDDLVTEQLARILIKQGNHKEAVKIYKKLIRKFPKKKSYFAGQIENLSKK